jgi:hypothetical protein
VARPGFLLDEHIPRAVLRARDAARARCCARAVLRGEHLAGIVPSHL